MTLGKGQAKIPFSLWEVRERFSKHNHILFSKHQVSPVPAPQKKKKNVPDSLEGKERIVKLLMANVRKFPKQKRSSDIEFVYSDTTK